MGHVSRGRARPSSAKLARMRRGVLSIVGAVSLSACSAPLPQDGNGSSQASATSPTMRPAATTSASGAPAPRVHARFGAVKEVALGGANLCVVLLDDQVQCVGEWPLDYQTPTSSGGKNQYIHEPITVKDAKGARGIVIETNRGCGIMPDGTVRCWGNTVASDSMWSGAKENELVAVPQPGIDHVKQIALTWKESCALREDGSITCWGPKLLKADRAKFPSTPPDGVAPATKIGGAYTHFCALGSRGTVSCWGEGTAGAPDGPINAYVAHPIAGVADAVDLSVGHGHGCALTKTGEVYCWGANANGELGLGKPSPKELATKVPGLDAVAIAASPGTGATCAIRRDGSVACWGADFNCDIGDAHAGACQKITHLSTFGPSQSEICASPQTVAMDGAFKPEKLSFGTSTICAKDAGGALRCWGRSLFGEANACQGRAP